MFKALSEPKVQALSNITAFNPDNKQAPHMSSIGTECH